MKFFSKAVLIAEVEGVSYPLVCSNVSFKPINASVLSRSHLKTHFGSDDFAVDTSAIDFGFEMEIPASIDDSTPLLAILRSCGLAQVATGLELTDSPSVAKFYYYIDDIMHIIDGAIGSFELAFSASNLAKVKFSFKGLVSNPEDSTNPIVSFEKFTPTIVSSETISVAFGTWDLSVIELGFNINNTLSEHKTISTHDIVLSNRSCKGNISLEGESIADFDVIDVLKNGQELDLRVSIGGWIDFYFPRVKISSSNYTNQDSRLTYQLDLVMLAVNGNDELRVNF